MASRVRRVDPSPVQWTFRVRPWASYLAITSLMLEMKSLEVSGVESGRRPAWV